MASKGQLMTIEEPQESARIISEEGAWRLRYAAMLANEVSHGKMDPSGLEERVFSPGKEEFYP
eukprot:345985-Karenia_brevis.AAC.1